MAGVNWLDSYGPAEYDRSLLPKGARIEQKPDGQGALFIVPRKAVWKQKPAAAELDGQEAMFPEPLDNDPTMMS